MPSIHCVVHLILFPEIKDKIQLWTLFAETGDAWLDSARAEIDASDSLLVTRQWRRDHHVLRQQEAGDQGVQEGLPQWKDHSLSGKKRLCGSCDSCGSHWRGCAGWPGVFEGQKSVRSRPSSLQIWQRRPGRSRTYIQVRLFLFYLQSFSCHSSSRKDLYLASSQIFPTLDDSEVHKRPLTRLQERLIKKLGANAFPFFFELPPHCPASVTLQPAPGDTGGPRVTHIQGKCQAENVNKFCNMMSWGCKNFHFQKAIKAYLHCKMLQESHVELTMKWRPMWGIQWMISLTKGTLSDSPLERWGTGDSKQKETVERTNHCRLCTHRASQGTSPVSRCPKSSWCPQTNCI